MAGRISPDRRRLAIMLAIGAVAIIALAAYSLTRGGGDSSSSPSTTRGTTAGVTAAGRNTRAPTAAPTTTTTTNVATMPESFDTFSERNPFQPAVDVVSGGATATSTPTAGAATAPPASGAATTPTTSAGNATTDTGGGAGASTAVPSQNPSSGTVVQLVEVFSQNGQPAARVQVGSTVYTVTAGQTFATSYKLVSLSGTCGQFLFGDSPFSLCTGEQVLK